MERVIFYFNPSNFKMEQIDTLIKDYGNRIKFSQGINPYMTYTLDNLSDDSIFKQIIAIGKYF